MWEAVRRDLRFGMRVFLRKPGGAVTVIGFALGVALLSIQLSIFRQWILSPLPYDPGGRLCAITVAGPPAKWWGDKQLRAADVDFLASRTRSFRWVASRRHFGSRWPIQIDGRPWRHGEVTFAGPGLIEGLGFKTVLGRGFQPADFLRGAKPVALLSHRVWKELGGDVGIMGRPVREKQDRVIVGVLAAGAEFPVRSDLWVPLAEHESKATDVLVQAVAELRPGVTLQTAREELASMSRASKLAGTFAVDPFREALLGPELGHLRLITWVVGVVFFMGCLNVLLGQLASSARRTRELALRAALGATRSRLVQQLLTEASVQSAFGLLGGLVLGQLGLRLVWPMVPDPPPWIRPALDVHVVATVSAMAVASTVIAALIPALRASRVDLTSTLHDDPRTTSGRTWGRMARALVFAQLAATAALLVVAVAMIDNLRRLSQMELSFDPDLTVQMELGALLERYPHGRLVGALAARFALEMSADPAITHATVGTRSLLDSGFLGTAIVQGAAPKGSDGESNSRFEWVLPGYFASLGLHVLTGREFQDQDDRTGRFVALIDTAFATKFFPGRDPVGRTFRPGRDDPGEATVVGVVPSLSLGGPLGRQRDMPGFYLSLLQMNNYQVLFALASGPSRSAVEDAIVRALDRADPALPRGQMHSIAERLEQRLALQRFAALLLASLGVSALLLAAIGTAGLIAFRVNLAQREFGIRAALGAKAGAIFARVVRRGLGEVSAGLMIGLPLGVVVARVVETVLDLPPSRVGLACVVALVLLGGATLVALVPSAVRAGRTDPAGVLHRS